LLSRASVSTLAGAGGRAAEETFSITMSNPTENQGLEAVTGKRSNKDLRGGRCWGMHKLLAPGLAVFFVSLVPAVALPPVVDDAGLTRALIEGLGKAVAEGKAVSGEVLKKAAAAAPRELALSLAKRKAGAVSPGYEALSKSVYIIGSVYKCGKCNNWHTGGMATGWALTSDGVMVTNAHVFSNMTGESWGVCSIDGKVMRITDVLAMNVEADLAVFRVDTGGASLRPLPLAEDAPVGARVTMISHPDGRFFFQTSGEVARYLMAPSSDGKKQTLSMSITADYAKGSSGGPALDASGAVVGIASSTQSIYYGSEKPEDGPLQMVVKNCVPVAALRAMVKKP
jgi:S1-C subfamily serine protease